MQHYENRLWNYLVQQLVVAEPEYQSALANDELVRRHTSYLIEREQLILSHLPQLKALQDNGISIDTPYLVTIDEPGAEGIYAPVPVCGLDTTGVSLIRYDDAGRQRLRQQIGIDTDIRLFVHMHDDPITMERIIALANSDMDEEWHRDTFEGVMADLETSYAVDEGFGVRLNLLPPEIKRDLRTVVEVDSREPDMKGFRQVASSMSSGDFRIPRIALAALQQRVKDVLAFHNIDE